jgi:hypothetical protein
MDRGTLKNAQALALFSNLTEKDVEYFRRNYAGFIPEPWWTVENYDTPIWKLWQELLQESWGKLSADRIVALLTLWHHQRKSSEAEESEVIAGMNIPTAYPYQHAVMFLAMEQWRAKYCENCGNRFVKEKPPQRFCSDACFKESRKAYKRTQWAEHGPEWLKNRKNPTKSKKPRR